MKMISKLRKLVCDLYCIVIFIIFAAATAGCSAPSVNATNENSLTASVNLITKDMSEQDRRLFLNDLWVIHEGSKKDESWLLMPPSRLFDFNQTAISLVPEGGSLSPLWGEMALKSGGVLNGLTSETAQQTSDVIRKERLELAALDMSKTIKSTVSYLENYEVVADSVQFFYKSALQMADD